MRREKEQNEDSHESRRMRRKSFSMTEVSRSPPASAGRVCGCCCDCCGCDCSWYCCCGGGG